MPARFAHQPKIYSNVSASKPSSMHSPLLVGALVLAAVIFVGIVVAQTPGPVSHLLSELVFTELNSNTQGIPAPVSPTVGSSGPAVTGLHAIWNQAVQWAAWPGGGNGLFVEHAQTAGLATDSGHLEALTLAEVLALAGGNDTIYMECPIAGGPVAVAGSGPFSLNGQFSTITAANCPGGPSDLACPTIGGTLYTGQGDFFVPSGLGMAYTLTPNYSGTAIIGYNISFFEGYVGSMKRACTKNP